MQHLTREKLEELTLRWEQWETEEHSPVRRVGRARLHLLFLLIRFGALRLGEALELNARQAVDTATGMVSVPGPYARDVLLPMPCMRHLRRILSLPEAEEMGDAFLRFDQGFVRKKFYAVAQPLGLDSNQVGPRAIRYARGLELLGLHVPLNLVQKYLGQHQPSQIAAFLNFAGGEAKRMVKASVMNRAVAPGVGPRNSFLGIITGMELGMRMARLEITTFADTRILALTPIKHLVREELHLNQVVTAFVDPDQITLASEKNVTSLSNAVSGVVDSMHREKTESFVCVALPDGTGLCANLETIALEKMRLREGKKVFVLFPARAVRLCLD